MVTQETIGYTMKMKYRKTLQLYIKIPIIKYIVYVLYKIKSSQNTLDRNTSHWSCKEYEKLTCWVEVTTIRHTALWSCTHIPNIIDLSGKTKKLWSGQASLRRSRRSGSGSRSGRKYQTITICPPSFEKNLQKIKKKTQATIANFGPRWWHL
jgi:hypothetical protein